MKTKFRFLAILLVLLLAFSGCKPNTAPETDTDAETQAESAIEAELDPVQAEINDFLATYVNTNERPIAVMIDNDDKNARPQAGLDDAYLMYEIVVEGGATRFMALFRGADTEKIGPVRSSRHYFLDFMMENGAIYTHYGWSPKAAQDISAFGIEKINGVLGGDGDIFWREEKFKGDWHSAYTSIENIKNMADKKGYSSETDRKNGIKYSDTYINLPAENIANDISLSYSGMYSTGYHYNPETMLYEKSINGAPHAMQDGTVLEFKNIIVELITDTALGDGSPRRDMNTTGSGKGYYITNGAYEEITWSKASRKENTVYTKADGTELCINPGKTVINVINPSLGVTIQ